MIRFKRLYAIAAIILSIFGLLITKRCSVVYRARRVYLAADIKRNGKSLNLPFRSKRYVLFYRLSAVFSPYYTDMVLPAAIEITFIFEQDPNAVQPLPPDPVKEGYTFTGWYYGTDEEHGENLNARNRRADCLPVHVVFYGEFREIFRCRQVLITRI